MKQINTPRISLLAALALATALTACSKQNDERTAGERVDGAVTGAQQSAQETRQDANQAMNNAGQSVENAADKTAQVTGDMAITAKVNAALVADDQLKATQINVDTQAGQVTLTGQAPDAQSRDRASTLASAVDGVKNVNNQLVVGKNS